MNSLICLTTVILNITPMALTVHDFDTMERYNTKCRNTGQCLTRFEKRGFKNYRAVCGPLQKFNRADFDRWELDQILKELGHLTRPALRKALEEIGYKINKNGEITK